MIAILLLALQADLEAGKAIVREGLFEEAERAFSALLETEPDRVDVLVERGQVREDNLGRRKEAIRDFARAVELAPGTIEPMHHLAWARKEDGDRDGATAAFRKLAGMPGEDALSCERRGAARDNLEEPREALAEFDRALKAEPDRPYALKRRASVRIDTGDYDGARKDCDRLLELGLETAEANFQKGRSFEHQARYEEAGELYRVALQADPKHGGAWYGRGFVLSQANDEAGAVRHYTKAIELGFTVAAAYGNRGNAKSRLGDHKGAIADFDESLRLDPNQVPSVYNRGYEKHQIGDEAGANADFRAVLELPARTVIAQYYRGLAFEALERPDEARRQYRRALKASLPGSLERGWIEEKLKELGDD